MTGMPRFIVGEPQNIPIWGQDMVPFYPLVDTETGEQFGELLYRYRNDAKEAATRYNMTLDGE